MEAQAIEILNIPPLERQHNEILVLMEFTRYLNFFRSVTKKTGSDTLHKACCQHMTLACYDLGSEIIEYGTIGRNFYILLSGTAEISVPRSTCDQTFTVVKQLGPGDSFGEQALMTGKPRAATVTSTSATTLAVLSKDSYQSLIATVAEREIYEKTEFLQALPLLQGWSRLSLMRLTYYFDVVKCKRKQILYSKGSPADYVYFVKSGEFLVSEVFVDTKSVVKHNSHTYKALYTNNSLLNLKNSRQVNILSHRKLAYKGTNEIIGAEEALKGSTHRELTCECVSTTGELYCIKTADFLTRVNPRPTMHRPLRNSSNHPSATIPPAKAAPFLDKQSGNRRPTHSLTELPKLSQTPRLLHASKAPSTLPQNFTPGTLFKKKLPDRHIMQKLASPNYLFSVRQGFNDKRLKRLTADSARISDFPM